MTGLLRYALPVLALLAVLWPSDGGAFCVSNGSDTEVHAESLSPPGFVADIPAGGSACCGKADCVKNGSAMLMLVTGYVPVSEGRPGWTAECRVKVSAKAAVEVVGSRKAITCKANGG